MALPLKDNVKLDRAIRELRDQAGRVGGLAVGGVTSADDRRTDYLNKVAAAEAQLRNFFTDPTLWTRLHGERHWMICSLSPSNPNLARLITDEAQEQERYLNGLAERLDRFARRADAAPGDLVVLDTNVLLHYEPPWQVNWNEVLGSKQPVRLVLPLRVIEELDEAKYRDRDKIPQRARGLLSQLWRVLEPSKGGPAALGDNTDITVEVFLDDEPRRRTLDADAEILEECRTLRAVGRPVSLVTADTGLSIRASALGIPVVPMPDDYLRNKPTPTPD